MPMVISAPSTKLPTNPTPSRGPDSASRSPPAGTSFSRPASMTRAASSSADPIPIWMLRRGSRLTRPEPRKDPTRRGGDQQHQGDRVDLDDADVDQRLGDDRDHVPDHQRAGDQLIGHQPQQAKQRGGRGERADPQRVEEVRDEADAQLAGPGGRPARSTSRSTSRRRRGRRRCAGARSGPHRARTSGRIRRGPRQQRARRPVIRGILTAHPHNLPGFQRAQSGLSSTDGNHQASRCVTCWLRRWRPRRRSRFGADRPRRPRQEGGQIGGRHRRRPGAEEGEHQVAGRGPQEPVQLQDRQRRADGRLRSEAEEADQRPGRDEEAAAGRQREGLQVRGLGPHRQHGQGRVQQAAVGQARGGDREGTGGPRHSPG